MSEDRHSKADPVDLISDPDDKARREAENGVRQFKAAIKVITDYVSDPDRKFVLTQSLVLQLHEIALKGIHPLAGTYRNTPVHIGQVVIRLLRIRRFQTMLSACVITSTNTGMIGTPFS
jgi:hypothetical protein